MDDKHVVIAAAMRTPIGAFQGVLTPCTAPQLGAAAIKGALAAANITGADVQEVIMGCVLPAGLGQAPARQAAIARGHSRRCAEHHDQQDVRLGHEGHHDGRGPDSRRRRGGRAWRAASSP